MTREERVWTLINDINMEDISTIIKEDSLFGWCIGWRIAFGMNVDEEDGDIEVVNRLRDIAQDINSEEIVSHIVDGNLDNWLIAWRVEAKRLVALLDIKGEEETW